MPRYVKQRDEFRCGPVAIVNVLKWMGCDATAKLIPGLCKELRVTKDYGTSESDLERALARRGKGKFSIRKDTHTSLKKIEARIREGMAVLLIYSHNGLPHNLNKDGEKWWHIVLVTGVSENGATFYIANYRTNDQKRQHAAERDVFRDDLRRRKSYGEWCDPTAWYLKKSRIGAR
jgi:hypothetical protein